MAAKKRGKKRGGSKRKGARRRAPATIQIRMANEGHMAKKRGKGKRRKGGHRRKASHHRPRRRNPGTPGTFTQNLGRLALAAVVAIGTGVAVTYAVSHISPGSKVSMYGIPALTFVGGCALYRKMPTLGAGIAIGAPSPFVVPVASQLMQPKSANATAQGIARAYRQLRAVDMGAVDLRGAYGAQQAYAYRG